MSEVLTYLKLPHVVEVDKTFCKDILNSGRIRVLLKNENGSYISNIKRSFYFRKKIKMWKFKIEKELLMTLGDLIPKLKSRVNQSYSVAETSTGGGDVVKKKDKKKKKK